MYRHSLLFGALLLALAACGDKPGDTQVQGTENASATSISVDVSTDRPDELKTAGDVDFPALPIIAAPDFIGTGTAQAALESQIAPIINPIDGISVRPAECGADGSLVNTRGIFTVDADNGGYTENSDRGIFALNTDGSGTVNFAGGIIAVNADGSGTINGSGKDGFDDAIISVETDGSGTYNGRYGTISLDGKGGGTWNGEHGIITNNGDGSGTWNGKQGIISINADGSGTWSGKHGIIVNNGDGTGMVDGKSVAMAPIPPVPPAGKFPLLNTLKAPGAPCGFVITLGDSVLFDFDKHDIRADASDVLDKLSAALQQVNGLRLIEIGGHTDAKGSDDYNQALSERRANSVVQALQSRGVTTSMSATGYGESRPIADNETGGKDNPAGRQLNRRVEIFVRTS